MKKIVKVFLLIIVITACSKYEDGPFISFRSKEKRLCKKWELDESENIENLKVEDFFRFEIEFKKNNEFIIYLPNNTNAVLFCH